MEYPERRSHWMALGNYTGSHLPDPDRRIDTLIALWRMSFPGAWQRGIDPVLLGPRYRRGDGNAPHAREHRIESELLAEPISAVT